MRLDQILMRLKKTGQKVFRTADLMALLGFSEDYASHALSRLTESEHIFKLKRGLWAFADNSDPLALSEHLVAPFPCYISLQSALYFHGIVSQIPDTVYSVTPARTSFFRTSAGNFSFHHIPDEFFTGFKEMSGASIQMATPEKALIDFFYLGPAKNRLFHSLPEIELPKDFSLKKAKSFILTIPSKNRRTMVRRRFEEFKKNCSK